ncbi:DUF3558 domain-containing protein [Amycolatopsis rhizosphaerae]|uniref:DUF3558 domain-containing protein n=1 Tax=Amycolatopsis rhizosphaerae TaxID=2053003 RepID=A0A558DPE1_9PSEU|nr:DUF3558 domain-containing protein [Amycolatopsis rhizosphaerae]TVT62857.1 DUF3558 domain-containing protein [Amycolatopsis rhizosphaerae]
MLKGKTGITAALACLAMLTASGCTQPSDGNPSPATGTTAPGTSISSTVGNGANKMPTIPKLLDVSRFAADPCLSIAAQQASDLTINPQGTSSPTGNDKMCTWKYGPNLDYSVSVSYLVPDSKNGLQNLYDLNPTGWFKDGYFEATTIDGYPAAYASIRDDRRTGRCQLALGVDATHIIDLQLIGSAGKDPCSSVAKVANAVVETVKGAQ